MNFNPANEVGWLDGRNGIRFYGNGIVYTSDASDSSARIPLSGDSVSIELVVQPRKEHTRSIAYILSFCDTGKAENLVIGQWRSDLIIRSGDANADNRRGFREISLERALQRGKTVFITITSGLKGTAVYVDGELVKEYPAHSLTDRKGAISGRILLGNSPSGKNPWTGNILGMALYGRELKADAVYRDFKAWTEGATEVLLQTKGIVLLYLFDEKAGGSVINRAGRGYNLVIPDTFQPLKRNTLVPIWKDFRLNKSYITDIAINIAGFIPLGFIISLLLYNTRKASASRMYLTAILSGSAISLAIELLQVYLPTRSSQMSDLIFNTMGTAIGVALFRFIVHKSDIFSRD